MATPATTEETPTTYLKDYVAFPYDIENVTLEFDLEDEYSVVTQTSVLTPTAGGPLVLDGRESFMELVGIYINDKPLGVGEYTLTKNAEDSRLTIAAPPTSGRFTLGVVTKFKPQDNLELSGLYKSSGNFCTQCEAEGFRLITYYPDRPDVMSIFTTKIRADKAKYPVLLSNGNLVSSCDLAGGRHMAVWQDPWRKPCYLFALVAGNLARITDSFTTMSGKPVELRIYAEEKNIGRCDFAMASLKRAMKWDEDTFGLEYDLDLFNIVAVDDFNMGAMENKGLNLFNSRLVLATADSATDAAYNRIEGVIGHEYFHNWTGNRVTCRDWFQLSLKEGLTVFRDQEFTSDMKSRSVKRIGDVRFLRDAQFAEDASPMAHPVRPASYMKIDNFYTLTVYEKGAELIRMYHTLLGKEGFRKGMDLYFKRHDGQAVTTDDFFAAMTDANGGNDISRLKNWYAQAGTPTLRCTRAYDAAAKTFSLTLEQILPKTPDTNGDGPKEAQLIPVAVGLMGADGADLNIGGAVTVSGEEGGSGSVATPGQSGSTSTVVLRLNAVKATFTFTGVEAEPVPSVLRGFSAPVKLEMSPVLSTDELLFALAHDTDPFNRWEASQVLATGIMTRTIKAMGPAAATAGAEAVAAAIKADDAWPTFTAACKGIIADATAATVDRAWVEEALSFPGVGPLVQQLAPVDPLAVFAVVKGFGIEFAVACRAELEAAYSTCKAESAGLAYEVDEEQTARRSFSGYALRYLGLLGHGGPEAAELAAVASGATNMTEVVNALGALSRHPTAEGARKAAFDGFLNKWRDDNNVICTYLSLVATMVHCANPLEQVKACMAAPDSVFDMKLPNKFYALIGGFARGNTPGFHAADGSGYRFITDCMLEMDKMNAIAASRIAKPFTEWRLYDPARQEMMKAELRRILAAKPSPNIYEICTKSLVE
eukprot:CAMPEP_0197580900 /NCGR_PEP_ID=MMETSP1326-20131121/4577_1 /TAXON_ID=1155430 /ORGANISM="Genus nov. species nov., Strain RCC2288" /LENGTH=934 /DNA_ID=CAMNT_0043144729 /DNA_START=30 /DNA_END=2834 /DNA_ORIENTATION=-